MGKYFTMGEMMRSATAEKKGIDNKCTKEDAARLKTLIEHVLDPLREAYGKPIIVTSGYRCQKLNEAVGGSRNSDHMRGCAADIVGTPNTKEENRRLFNLIQSLDLDFDQLIDEKNYSWVHVSFRSFRENRNQVFAM